jgi:ABC-type glycerol-3-phosphate transport system substrate-binding protein
MVTRRLACLALGMTLMAPAARAGQVPEFWHYMGAGGEYQAVKAMIAEVNKQFPATPVTERVIPGHAAGLRQQIQVSLMGGDPPAVYQVDIGVEVGLVAKAGRALDIEDVWKDIDGDRIFPEGIRRIITFDGKHVAIPIDMSIVNNVFYNKSVFEKLGLVPPKTWDEWDAVCAKLKAGNVSCLANGASGPWSFYNMYPALLETMGTDGYWKFARGEISLKSPEFRQALDLYRKRFARNYVANWTAAKWSDGADQLMRGNVGMYMVGDWASGYMKERGFKPGVDYDFFPAPGTEKISIFQADTVVALKGDQTAAAKNFMKGISSPAAQAAFNILKGSLAPNSQTPTDIYDPVQKREFEKLNAAGNTTLPNLIILMPVDYRTALRTEIERFASNPTDEALNALVEKLEPQRLQAEKSNLFIKW